MARILIVEDEERVRDVVRLILTRSKHEVVEAANGAQGLTAYRTGTYDLVVTDIMMPEKDGIQMITELRAEFGNPRIIAISGGARINNADVFKLALEAGAAAVVAKPFTPKVLMEAVDTLLAADKECA